MKIANGVGESQPVAVSKVGMDTVMVWCLLSTVFAWEVRLAQMGFCYWVSPGGVLCLRRIVVRF